MKSRIVGIASGVCLLVSALTGPIYLGTGYSGNLENGRESFEYGIGCTELATNIGDDLDPLVDVIVTVEIKEIRSLEKNDLLIRPIDKIDPLSDPDFYVKVSINGTEFTSPVWENQKYIYDPQYSASLNVPDDIELVNITLQLWDANPGRDKLCDISDNADTYTKSTS